jgi:hypothetical protein
VASGLAAGRGISIKDPVVGIPTMRHRATSSTDRETSRYCSYIMALFSSRSFVRPLSRVLAHSRNGESDA